ncbi:uncharacterized protein B0H64DRAFT_408235 [Chaetomium fimeti]|uniref:Secreted protein n=1 Tax=Chaetomium fimeti TaxID=1854472 RepID=A0AAE0LNM8_9PEZI|nr:hypothetical protein B0H64DRAFT_408235 [Chaetomium fimeti]
MYRIRWCSAAQAASLYMLFRMAVSTGARGDKQGRRALVVHRMRMRNTGAASGTKFSKGMEVPCTAGVLTKRELSFHANARESPPPIPQRWRKRFAPTPSPTLSRNLGSSGSEGRNLWPPETPAIHGCSCRFFAASFDKVRESNVETSCSERTLPGRGFPQPP